MVRVIQTVVRLHLADDPRASHELTRIRIPWLLPQSLVFAGVFVIHLTEKSEQVNENAKNYYYKN